MTIRISWGVQPYTPPAGETRAEFNARVYGRGWEDTRRRYWASPFTRKRCVWCMARRATQLNHLTYLYSGPDGACPFWVLRPMCRTCHKVETWVTGKVRPRMPRGGPRDAHGNIVYPAGRRGRYGLIRHQKWAHAVVTFWGAVSIRLSLVASSLVFVF